MTADNDNGQLVQITTMITLKQKRALQAAAHKQNIRMAAIIRRGLDLALGTKSAA